MLALFRLVEISEGKIEVDGVDVSKLGLTTLRSGGFPPPPLVRHLLSSAPPL